MSFIKIKIDSYQTELFVPDVKKTAATGYRNRPLLTGIIVRFDPYHCHKAINQTYLHIERSPSILDTMTLGKLTDEQIEEVLTNNSVGRIGCSDGQQTYVVPVTYVYDGRHIIAHSMYGMKIRIMRSNPSVCFEVDEIESPVKWKSVITWGTYQELLGERDRLKAMKLFVEKFNQSPVSITAHPPDLLNMNRHLIPGESARAIIYRIILETKTGRFENE